MLRAAQRAAAPAHAARTVRARPNHHIKNAEARRFAARGIDIRRAYARSGYARQAVKTLTVRENSGRNGVVAVVRSSALRKTASCFAARREESRRQEEKSAAASAARRRATRAKAAARRARWYIVERACFAARQVE